MTPSDTKNMQKGKVKRNSEILISTKKWTPISTQWLKKPCNSASIKGKPTLTALKGKITVINPASTSNGKFSKYVENKQDSNGNNSHTPIQLPTQQTPQTKGFDRAVTSTLASPTPQRPVPMDHLKQEIQPGFTLGRTWGKIPEDISQRYFIQGTY
ncbi:hypothetical protein O181_072472 [Austropuccinia psidii MF-1]|uniref:Uncharacterized protein n=1 Tax=Austropuccinia psidii MF-1 TaxID=1389203 RepID=A0A9Q3F9J8_9BASI|nr:hypothetical protein [Austropuccinia psidii MF-1]